MSFAQPERLFGLVLMVVVILLAMAVKRRVRQRLTMMFGEQSSGFVATAFRNDQFNVRLMLLTLATCLLVVAFAKPQWGFRWQEVRGRGASIFVAIDLSKSMYAEDQKPNRLERAKRKVIDFLRLQKGDRIGLIAFAGDAFIQIPLTQDYGAVEMFLEMMSPEKMPRQGTSFSKAISTAVEAFKHLNGEESLSDALVIMSDGEDHDPGLDAALSEAKASNVKIYTLGFGTEEGAPIPDNGGGFKKDSDGSVVVTKLQTGLLKKIADSTGGVFQKASVGDDDWQRIYQGGIKKDVSEAEFDSGRKRVAEDRSYWFALAGVVLLIVQFFLGHSPKLLLALWCCGAGMWFAHDAYAQAGVKAAPASEQKKNVIDPVSAFERGDFAGAKAGFKEEELRTGDARSTFNRAVSSYRLGDYKDASEGFAKAAQSKDQDLAAKSLFNLGNSEAMNENFDGAISAYEDALKLAPNNQKIRDNLSAVKQRREEKKQQPQQKDQKDKPSDENNGQDQKNQPKSDAAQDEKDQSQKKEGGKDGDAKDNEGKEQDKAPSDPSQAKDQASSEQSKKADDDKSGSSGQGKEEPAQPTRDKDDAKEAQRAVERTPAEEQSRKDADRILKGVQDHAQEIQAPQRKFNGKQQTRDDAKDW